ncbi:hypothetical protein JXI42_01040 [bacterium]|nr:hypothetical protein [bacterium]
MRTNKVFSKYIQFILIAFILFSIAFTVYDCTSYLPEGVEGIGVGMRKMSKLFDNSMDAYANERIDGEDLRFMINKIEGLKYYIMRNFPKVFGKNFDVWYVSLSEFEGYLVNAGYASYYTYNSEGIVSSYLQLAKAEQEWMESIMPDQYRAIKEDYVMMGTLLDSAIAYYPTGKIGRETLRQIIGQIEGFEYDVINAFPRVMDMEFGIWYVSFGKLDDYLDRARRATLYDSAAEAPALRYLKMANDEKDWLERMVLR